MVAIDYSVLVQILAFLLLWFVLTKLLFQPFLRLLEERERKTDGARSDAAALFAESERLKKEYEGRMAKAREEGEAAKQAIIAEAAQAREHRLARARDDAARLLQTSRQQLAVDLESDRGLIGEEAEAAGRQIAEKILGRKIG